MKSVENHTTQFLKSLNQVETKLTEQVNYLTQVSTGQPHEGSGYASAKVLQMAWHRIHHVKSRVRDLEESKQKYLQNQARGGGPMQGRMIGAVGGGQSASGGASGPANTQQMQGGSMMSQQQTNGSGSQGTNQ